MAKKKKATKASSDVAVCLIEDFLFLGPVSVASNAAFLTSKSISHVVSIGHDPPSKLELLIPLELPSPSSPARTVPLQYHRLRLVDSGASPSALSACTDAACTLLEAIRAQGGRALVHCSAGISRSPTVAVAYMVRHCGMTLRAALGTVVCARPAVCPNPDFVRWLKGEEVRVRGGGEATVGLERLPARVVERVAWARTALQAPAAVDDDAPWESVGGSGEIV